MQKYTFVLLIVLIALVGCTTQQGDSGNGNTVNSNNQTLGDNLQQEKNPIAVFKTNKGTFKAEIYADKAPITGKNFVELAKSGFYNGLSFHRYVEGFVIQGGDPKGDGTGGSSKKIPLEIVPGLTHVKGSLGMARSQDPNSASSQFYVSLEDIHQLDGNYAVFGQVTDGFGVVQQLRQGDIIERVSIE